jgi:hypothetical protein
MEVTHALTVEQRDLILDTISCELEQAIHHLPGGNLRADLATAIGGAP